MKRSYGNKLLAVFITLAMLIAACAIMYVTPVVKAWPPTTTPGVNDFGNATTDLTYDPDNGVNIYFNCTGLTASTTYYLYKPVYNCTDTSQASLFQWYDSAVRDTNNQVVSITTDSSPTNDIVLLGNIKLDRAGMWILDKSTATSHSGNDPSTFDGFFWVNTSTEYTIDTIDDFDYGTNATKYIYVRDSTDTLVSCYVDLIDPNGQTVLHKYHATGVPFGTYGNITMAGNYTVRAYVDLDLGPTYAYEYKDETDGTYGAYTGYYATATSGYGSNFSSSLNTKFSLLFTLAKIP